MEKDKKQFLCTLEFRSGEHAIPFYHIVKARNMNSAKNKIHKWLIHFYEGQFDEKDNNIYYYLGGEVAVELNGIDLLQQENFIMLLTIN